MLLSFQASILEILIQNFLLENLISLKLQRFIFEVIDLSFIYSLIPKIKILQKKKAWGCIRGVQSADSRRGGQTLAANNSKMDDGRQHENGRHKMDYYRGAASPWNMATQQQAKEPNALVMNKKIMSIIAERDAAIRERNAALTEKNEALAARDEALRQRDEALAQRDTAMMERDNAFAALHMRDNAVNFPLGGGVQRGAKRLHHPSNHSVTLAEAHYSTKDMHITDAFPISVISAEAVKSRQTKRAKENKASRASKPSRKKVGEDLNRQASSDGIKYKSEWDTHDLGLNLVSFDESTMPVPVCSCTGVPRQCYKWGNGGWQSSCCTTHMSMYPLPQMPNKRHARMGGRKMSGSVFTRLLSRLAADGHDLSIPLDLKEYWARHGTNRYITIK